MDIFLEMDAPEDLCQHLFLSFVRPSQVDNGEVQVSNIKYMNIKIKLDSLKIEINCARLLHWFKNEIEKYLKKVGKIFHVTDQYSSSPEFGKINSWY